jgi:probable biosynthetic protein (TIGR04099 family)
MTAAVLDFPTPIPTSRELMERALEPHVLIGMPHLMPHGLSETWLMKELGHRHWLMLARAMGMDDADFRTADDSEAYAAICATALRDARLHEVSANTVLMIRSTLSSISRTQVSSVHRLSAHGKPIGEVELLSTFVHRLHPGDNHSIARVPISGLPCPDGRRENRLAQSMADMRGGKPGDAALPGSIHIARFQTSVSQEFNGAGLFYFVEFQALMERACERLFPAEASHSRIRHREVFFLGNIRENELLDVVLFAKGAGTDEIGCHICRTDGKIITYASCTRAET